MNVYNRRTALCQRSQLVEMCCKEREGANVLVDVLGHRPREAEPIVRRRATTKLINDNKRSLCRGRNHVSSFLHLTHEGACTEGHHIASTNTAKDAVDKRELRLFCGHITPDLRKDRENTNAAHVRAFATHVGPRDQGHGRVRREVHVVWHGLGTVVKQEVMQRRCPQHATLVTRDNGRAAKRVAAPRDNQRPRCKHVQLGNDVTDVVQHRAVRAHGLDKFVLQFSLPRQVCLLRGAVLRVELRKLCRDELDAVLCRLLNRKHFGVCARLFVLLPTYAEIISSACVDLHLELLLRPFVVR
eukprot:PhM_4_TR3440/c0_g1_i1/m.24720